MQMKEIFRAGGGVAKLARAIERDHSTLLGWRQVPVAHLAAVSAATGIAPATLRPDLAALFGATTPQPQQEAA